MPGIEKGLACIGIWLACSSIVLDATNPQDSVSELSSHHQNSSATSVQGSFGFKKWDEHDSVISRSLPEIEEQGNKVAAVVDDFEVTSSNFFDRLEELRNESIATTQELRSSFHQILARIASMDKSLAEIAELTNKTLARSEQILSAYNSTRIQLNETESSLCPYSTSGSLARVLKWLPNDCLEIYQSGCYESGIYQIRPLMSWLDAFPVYCEMTARGGGWTVLQNRMDGSVNFTQKWSKYKDGFGSLGGEFWLGLERIHRLTNSKRYELLIELEDFDGESRFAVYDNFVVSSEEEKYSMQELGSYTGTAGDSLSYHSRRKFTTWDQNNEAYRPTQCASTNGGGWWFHSCASAALNGYYPKGQFTSRSSEYLSGIIWETWRGNSHSYKKSRMSIRPVQL